MKNSCNNCGTSANKISNDFCIASPSGHNFDYSASELQKKYEDSVIDQVLQLKADTIVHLTKTAPSLDKMADWKRKEYLFAQKQRFETLSWLRTDFMPSDPNSQRLLNEIGLTVDEFFLKYVD